MGKYKISELAKLSGVTVKSIRVYEDMEILSSIRHYESNYRLYAEDSIGLVKNIKLLQNLGLSLKEISMIHSMKKIEVEFIKSILHEQLNSTNNKLFELEDRRLILSNIIQKITEGEIDPSIILTAKEKDIFMGITTGFTKLDKLLRNDAKGQLVVIAARPNLGKTALTIHIAHTIMEQTGLPITFFSTEYDHREWTKRLAIQKYESEFGKSIDRNNLDKMDSKSKVEYERLYECIQRKKINFRYDKDISIDEILEQTQKLKHSQGAIVIDYLQSIHGNSEDKCKKLKDLALKLDCPILVISTILPGADKRKERRPILEDLRDYSSMPAYVDKLLIVSSAEALPVNAGKKIANVEVYSDELQSSDLINLIWNGSYCGYSDKL